MKASEIRELSNAELNEKLTALKAELFNLRFQHAINQLENPMRMKEVKKDIARIKTVLRQLEMKNVQLTKGGFKLWKETSEKRGSAKLSATKWIKRLSYRSRTM